jgi:hypothetical protein
MLLLNESQIMEKSLDTHTKMTFKEFISFNDIDLNTIMVDKIFHNIQSNMPIYMDEAMVEYFGYSGKLVEQRKSLVKLIETNFSDYQNQLWHSYKNKEYIEFCEKTKENLKVDQSPFKNDDENLEISSLYPDAPTGKSAARIKHLLISPKLFKEMLMLAQTEKGKQVRRYYIDMMDVMEIYIKFQSQVQIKYLDGQLADIKLMLTNYEKRFEDESDKREADSNKREAEFNKLMGIATETKSTLDTVLPQRVDIKSNDPDYPQVFILRDLDAEENEYNFYAMRCQTSNYNSRLKELKAKYGDNIKRACTIKQPNAIVFWKSVKKTLHANLICDSKTNWFSLHDMTKIQFKNKISELNDKRINPV